MKYKIFIIISFILISVAIFAGCSSTIDERLAGNLDFAIDGKIISIEPVDIGKDQINVENAVALTVQGNDPQKSIYPEAIVIVDNMTGIDKLDTKFLGDSSIFSNGENIKVYYNGTVTKSIPPQINAKLIEFV